VRRYYTDHRAMLDGERLDAVIVCMHPRRQAQAAIECLERGVHRFLNGFATHHLDLPRFFMGEVEAVSADRVSRGPGLDGYAITLRFASGGVGLVNVNCLEGEHNNWSERVAVTGVGGRVFVENWRRVIGFLPDDSQTYYWEPQDIRPADDQSSLAIHGFVGELRDFVESVPDGRAPACTIEDGIAALRLERAVERSAEQGRKVRLEEVVDDGR
jgi:predicted dehydrogenase